MRIPTFRKLLKAITVIMSVFIGLFLLIASVFAVKVFTREPLKAVPSTNHASLDRNSCAKCHAPIAEEWRESFHHRTVSGKPWKDVREMGYMDIFNKIRKPCLNCHAPANVLDLPEAGPDTSDDSTLGVECTPNLLKDPKGKIPSVRVENVEEGVDCVSCHVSKRGITGAGHRPTSEHETISDRRFQDPAVTSAAFCITCHGSAVDAWSKSRLAADGVTCLDCHMPWITAPSVTGGPERLRRSHRFPADKDQDSLKTAVHGSLEKMNDGKMRFRIINDRVGHFLPSGGNWLLVILKTYDASGRLLNAQREDFGREEALLLDFWPFGSDNRIMSGTQKDILIPLPEGHGRVEAMVRYWDWKQMVSTVLNVQRPF